MWSEWMCFIHAKTNCQYQFPKPGRLNPPREMWWIFSPYHMEIDIGKKDASLSGYHACMRFRADRVNGRNRCAFWPGGRSARPRKPPWLIFRIPSYIPAEEVSLEPCCVPSPSSLKLSYRFKNSIEKAEKDEFTDCLDSFLKTKSRERIHQMQKAFHPIYRRFSALARKWPESKANLHGWDGGSVHVRFESDNSNGFQIGVNHGCITYRWSSQ